MFLQEKHTDNKDSTFFCNKKRKRSCEIVITTKMFRKIPLTTSLCAFVFTSQGVLHHRYIYHEYRSYKAGAAEQKKKEKAMK